ncbi:Glyoxalase/bleomycin resistance protein/dioxygenase [mine drainage metagenome]|uniref:Glyoxalase/bleomycin resistance protein/dioxygenase n=2 Tax=mine drainage metagenome TaxID=410659 RepID=T1DA36_9ZZZZ
MLAIPTGSEPRARDFYGGLLGLTEQVKPPNLARRGGLWFTLGDRELHLGIDPEFRPARKAHVAILVPSLAELRAKLEAGRVRVWTDEPLPGMDRFYAEDPFGNRLEFLQPLAVPDR